MRLFIAITAFLTMCSLKAQSGASREFGKISSREMEMTHCAFDSSAGAMVLFDVGKSVFLRANNGFRLKFTRHKRIKVFRESGRDYAEIEIPFYISDDGEKEKIRDIEAYTYNFEDGKPVRQSVAPSSI
ncbi:MAG: hypothetical protein AAGI38_05670, partial [Bacteroidota bacterium]